MTDPIDSLVEAMGTTAEGYGAIIDGILNIRTVTDTRGGAAMNALYICGYHVIGCNDPECTCREEALKELRPDVQIVPVRVGVKMEGGQP